MDRYVAAEASSNQERVQGAKRDQGGAQGKTISPANPRQKANRRAWRRHPQLHRTQAQPTLNWYGFKHEVEERRVQSADFADGIIVQDGRSSYISGAKPRFSDGNSTKGRDTFTGVRGKDSQLEHMDTH